MILFRSSQSILTLASLWVVTLFFSNVTVANEHSLPNIVIFLVDDMGVMDTSVPFLTDADGQPQRHALNDYFRTPNMERLAAQGVRFSQFCAMSVCSPSRLSIMTGQNAARHRTTNWIHAGQNNATPHGPRNWNWHGLKQGDVTIASLLNQQGYRTIHVGKAHFGPRDEADPRELGFDINIAGGGMGRPASYYAEDHYGHLKKRENGKPNANAVPHLEHYHDSGLFLTEALTREAKQHLTEAVQAEKPFFLHFAHYAVHGPFQLDPRYAEHYPEDSELPQIHKFATLIEGMDQSLGDVLDHLNELGVANNTLILFLSDNGSDAPRGDEHGIASSAPLRGKKGTHYEGGTRIPFIAAWAQLDATNPHQQRLPISSGAIQNQLASICDLLPTLTTLCGIDVPSEHQLDGAPLQTLLSGQPDEGRDETFLMHYPHRHRSEYFTSYRDGNWKVVYHYLPSAISEDSHYQLFNLNDDPSEQKNLASSHPLELHRMMHKLILALEECDALYPTDPESKQPLRPVLPPAK